MHFTVLNQLHTFIPSMDKSSEMQPLCSGLLMMLFLRKIWSVCSHNQDKQCLHLWFFCFFYQTRQLSQVPISFHDGLLLVDPSYSLPWMRIFVMILESHAENIRYSQIYSYFNTCNSIIDEKSPGTLITLWKETQYSILVLLSTLP